MELESVKHHLHHRSCKQFGVVALSLLHTFSYRQNLQAFSWVRANDILLHIHPGQMRLSINIRAAEGCNFTSLQAALYIGFVATDVCVNQVNNVETQNVLQY